jgi:hypothetical protein
MVNSAWEVSKKQKAQVIEHHSWALYRGADLNCRPQPADINPIKSKMAGS